MTSAINAWLAGETPVFLALWWRGWDSNPRYGETVNQISSLAHSTTLPPLRSGASAGRCRGRDSRACVALRPAHAVVFSVMPAKARIAEPRLPALARRERRGVGDRSGRDDVAGDDRPALGLRRHRVDPEPERVQRAVEDDRRRRLPRRRGRRTSSVTRNAASSRRVAGLGDEALDRHARADEEAPVQGEVGDGVGGGEAPAGEVRVDDLEAVRDPVDAAGELARGSCRRRGARAKPNMISGSSRGCDERRQRDARLARCRRARPSCSRPAPRSARRRRSGPRCRGW